MLTFISVFAILGVYCIDLTSVLNFQLNVDQTYTYDIVLLTVFQFFN